MNTRILNIDEIASIRNKYYKQNNMVIEPEPADEESDLSIIKINNKEYYIDLNNNLYNIKENYQIGTKIIIK